MNRWKKRCKVYGSPLEYVKWDIDACKACCTFSVPVSPKNWSSFTAGLVMNCSEALHWLFSVRTARTAHVSATVLVWVQQRKPLTFRYPTLKDTEKSVARKAHPKTIKAVCHWIWLIVRLLSREPSMNQNTGRERLRKKGTRFFSDWKTDEDLWKE